MIYLGFDGVADLRTTETEAVHLGVDVGVFSGLTLGETTYRTSLFKQLLRSVLSRGRLAVSKRFASSLPVDRLRLSRPPELADKVDQFLIVGSPGVPFERACQIGTDVAVSIAEDDAIKYAGNPFGHNECRVIGTTQVCDQIHPWDPEFGAEVLNIPNQAYAGRLDGVAAHGVYLDDARRARQLINWAYTRSFQD